jgi:hypothetical protein
METTMRNVFRSRWWMPAFSVFLGVLMLTAGVAGETPGLASSGWS